VDPADILATFDRKTAQAAAFPTLGAAQHLLDRLDHIAGRMTDLTGDPKWDLYRADLAEKQERDNAAMETLIADMVRGPAVGDALLAKKVQVAYLLGATEARQDALDLPKEILGLREQARATV
jgi:hypothetical protein